MKSLLRYTLKQRALVIALALATVAVGIASALSIRQEKYPDVELPTLLIQAQAPNRSAEEVERAIAAPLENAIGGLRAYDSLTSQTSSGMTVLQASYEFGTDMDKLEQTAEGAVAKLALPEGTNVTFRRVSADARPVYETALAGEDAEALRERIQSKLLPELRGLDGVGSVTASGLPEPKLVLTVDEAKADAAGLTLTDIRSALQQSAYSLPLGTLAEADGRTLVQLEGQVPDLDALLDVPLPSKASGVLRLRDVAEAKLGEQAVNIARYNGRDAVLLEVYKTQTSNTAEVTDAVKRSLDAFLAGGSATANTVVDQGADVKESVASLLREGAFGALFTVLVILLFLRNVRATAIAILSLPLSILGTISILHAMGYTLNIMTMGGMAVAVGRIVDDSIVVIENLYRWLRREKETSRGEIVLRAVQEVAGAVSSSTVATVVVFLPLAFVGGIVGEFFRPFSAAVVVSILLSLLIAFLLIPVLATLLFRHLPERPETGRLAAVYGKLLGAALSRKAIVLALAAVLLAGSLGMLSAIGKSFLPSEAPEGLTVRVTLPATAGLVQTDAMARQLEDELRSRPEVAYVQTFAGPSDSVQALRQNKAGNRVAELLVGLNDPKELDRLRTEWEKTLTEKVRAEYPDGLVSIEEQQKDGPPTGSNIEVTLYGDDPGALQTAAEQVQAMMNNKPGLKNVSSTASQLQSEYVLTLTDEARGESVQPSLVYAQTRDRLQPLSAGSLTIGGRSYDASLQYDRTVGGKDDLLALPIATPAGPIKLGELAEVTEKQVPASIEHQNGRTAAKLTAVADGESVGRATGELKTDLSALSLPEGVRWEVGGGQQMMRDGFHDLGIAMASAIALVFVVLFLTFGGAITPIVILSSLLFVPFGSLGALMLAGETLSMSGMIGMLMLIGIVVTNAVVMLERAESNRRAGMGLEEAIREACAVRSRPILMTALATVCALIPLALSHSASGLISKGLAISVIGGLTTSTLLTLVFIPVTYAVLGKWRRL